MTAMDIVLMTESPPMTRARSAEPVVIAEKMTDAARNCSTNSLGGAAFTPGTSRVMRRASSSSSTPGRAKTSMLFVSTLVSIDERIAGASRSTMSLCASSKRTNAPLSGAVSVFSRIPTTVNSRLSSPSRGSLGGTGRRMVRPTLAPSWRAKSAPRTTSPLTERSIGRPCAYRSLKFDGGRSRRAYR